jgi:hypothetical protein
MEARLPREKHDKAIELVADALRRPSLTRRELDSGSLVRFLSFASRIFPGKPPFPTPPLRCTGYPQPSATQAIEQHWARAHQRSGQARPPQWNGIRLHDAQGTRNPQPHRLSLGTRPSKERSSATSSMERHTPPRRTGYPQPSATQAITRHTPIKGVVKRDLLNGTAFASTTHRVPATLSHAGYHSAHTHQRSGQARPQVVARVPTSSMERQYASTTHRVPATLSHAGYRAKPIKGAVKRDLKWWQEFLRPQWNGNTPLRRTGYPQLSATQAIEQSPSKERSSATSSGGQSSY